MMEVSPFHPKGLRSRVKNDISHLLLGISAFVQNCKGLKDDQLRPEVK